MTGRFCLISKRLIGSGVGAVSLTIVSIWSTNALAQSANEESPPPPAYPESGAAPDAPPPALEPANGSPPPEQRPRIRLSEEPPARKIVFDAAPAPQGEHRAYHYHDGFYLRASLNYGPAWGSFTVGEGDQTQLDFTGGLLDFNLLIAGTPSPGFSVGGGLQLGSLLQPDLEQGGDDVATSNVGFLLVGPFVDGYFNPNGGWHMGALAGLAGLGKTPHTDRALGFGGSVFLGYDAWVGADWALGGILRFTAAAVSGTEPVDFSSSALALSLGFSALYH